ncbi:MAG: FtsW/RodA/SpoVE family cell cycle protein [Oscillospiraceae bacterium]|nr:FtsW/RodA/SpoVE family cell cycle protein [Oscillospiraceae bacterium]
MANSAAKKRYNFILSAESPTKENGKKLPVQETVEPQNGKKPKEKEPGLRLYDGPLDTVFFIIIIVLLVCGIVMMFSASYIEGLSKGDGYMYVRTQCFAAVVGVLLMVFISFWDYHILMNSKIVISAFVVLLGLLTYTTFFGDAEYGARRWIYIGNQSIQPSEMMKPVLIVFLAYIMVKKAGNFKSFRKDVFPLIVVMGLVCINMVFQRHISGLLLMGVIGLVVIFVGGMPWKQFMQLIAVIAVAAVVAILLYSMLTGGGLSYILDRIKSMGQADEEINDDTWQTAQSLIAIGSGGWFGLGFGESRQKYLWLPESQNDFIISIIVEELGYLGGLVVVLLFGLFIYRGFHIARKAPDRFGMLIVMGIIFQLGTQAILNIGVACNAFPNTGISLPFFSSGGTALLIQLAEMGVVLAVSRQSEV